jgi:nucleotide-binding universal stress UspA family protein
MKVLYATDGGEPAYAAGELIERFADPERVEVTVLCVTETGVSSPESLPYMLDDLDERGEIALQTVDQNAQRLRSAGFKVRGHTAEGDPAREIVRLVEDEWFDLTVMGGGSQSWLENHLLGSASTYVLHHSPSSVLVVHAAPRNRDTRVLVGVDGSRAAERAIHELTGFLVPGSTVKTFSVAPMPPVAIGVPYAPVPVVDTPRWQEAQRHAVARAWGVAEDAAHHLLDAGYKAEADTTAGHAAEELLKEAKRGSFDLVVVGSRGLTALKRTLMGSVSDNVARHANAALVVRRAFD